MATESLKKPKLSFITKAAIAILGLIVLMISCSLMQEPMTPEKLARERAAADKEIADMRLHGVARSTYIAVRQQLKDPDSMQVEQLLASTQPEVACLAYRARNGFGGMVRDVAIWDGKTYRKTAADWKKLCTGPTVQDLTYLSGSMAASYARRHQ